MGTQHSARDNLPSAPAVSLTGKQKAEIAELESRYKAKLAEREDDLKAAIEAFLTAWNKDPKPFVWTAKAANILEKVVRGRKALESVH